MTGIAIALTALMMSGPADAAEPHVFRDCAECPEMLVIAPGQFVMGAADERVVSAPPVEVSIPHAFALSVTEITFNQYQACLDAQACTGAGSDHGWGRDRRPVINVTWAEAVAYADWLSRITGHRYRLPSEAEWEFAARAGTAMRYPWGDAIGTGLANCRGCGAPPWSGDRTAPVASLPREPSGLFDMHGNVSEWVADCWAPAHDPQAHTATPRQIGDGVDCTRRVTKGGDWYYIPQLATSAARQGNVAVLASYTIGFRVLREVGRDIERKIAP